MTLSSSKNLALDVFMDDDGRVWADIDGGKLVEYVPREDLEKAKGRILRLESIGAVEAVAGPLRDRIAEAQRLLEGALEPGAVGRPVRGFTRGEMADLEAALDALR
jgi:hypothetical protein